MYEGAAGKGFPAGTNEVWQKLGTQEMAAVTTRQQLPELHSSV